jgi:hypothetical protein
VENFTTTTPPALSAGSWKPTATIDLHLPYSGEHFSRFERFAFATHGVLRRDGTGAIHYRELRPHNEIAPSRFDLSLNNRDAQGMPITPLAVAGEVTAWNTRLLPELRGFLFCDAVNSGSVVGCPLFNYQFKHPVDTTIIERINGELVKYPADMNWWLAPAPSAFERDAFIL